MTGEQKQNEGIETHGTWEKYDAGCRCYRCKKAHQATMIDHERVTGATNYSYGCRCATCTAAFSKVVKAAERRRRFLRGVGALEWEPDDAAPTPHPDDTASPTAILHISWS